MVTTKISRRAAGAPKVLAAAAAGALAVFGAAACGGSDSGDAPAPTTTTQEAAPVEEDEPDEPDTSGPTEVSSLDLAVGDCLLGETDLDGVVGDVEVVACDEEHGQEVFAVESAEDGEYPGEDAVAERAEEFCAEAFAEFVGVDYNESELEINLLYPTGESWAEGDRELVCLVYDPEGPTVGTLSGAAR